ncbi:MAG: hypothetical protein U0793_06705 [Gemmataceae bacterium]
MKCHECEAWIERWLDATGAARPSEPADLPDHLAECRSCREQYAAAQRLIEGVKALPRVAAPRDFTERIVQRVLADRVERRRRLTWRLSFTAALAASIVLMLIGGYFFAPGPKAPDVAVVSPTPKPEPAPEAPPVLAKRVDEAKEKVAALTGKLTEKTVEHAKQLFAAAPTIEFNPMGEGVLPSEPIDAAASLRRAGAELTASMAPVTRSARRAMDFFRREISTFEVKQ